ncbi:Na+/H+ antiporter subunit A [Agromyces marinus]|uniref:Monovalent cation/H+ antiporter subunit A n=1 Tax=Agromyces marinus TaxID=1389020 RepID=A0ABM8H396_9MICO|nr:Na+/H+ antiporter subunit A [Agromyces marinus]UIP59669.1 NAD(P)H-quinone oxidoreductase subunit 2, chloroplastic [Agromyces marinus]BDZ55259.1 monovalent cation/H+ antiporter subunit A [Agromyces marinus]
MIISLVAFAAVALVTPLLVRFLGRHVFPVIAIVPTAVFAWLLTLVPAVSGGEIITERVEWIPTLGIALSFRLDALSLLLALIVTGVGALVLLYCTWYFRDDEPSLDRFAALLLAFAGVMLGLVASDDVFVMFTFWEATSVLSYLLIGHAASRREARGAALQALTVTTFGGLAMLVGLVALTVAGGTTSLSELVSRPVTGTVAEVAVALVLVGAVSKSALVPFHFWLPAAMAAPTPVSAYLHAAAMVKAGVYLVALLAPGYASLAVWHPMVIGIGGLTMLVGGWRALRQTDLKLVLAYGTVSQLGFLILVVGQGTRDAALAGVAMLLAHALFKAALFLTVGIVDHAAGTRDKRRLSGLWRRMPWLAGFATLAAASMAGLPPMFGFVAKEAVFTAQLEAGAAGSPWAWVGLGAAAVGSVLTFAYSARFVLGAFGTRRGAEPTPVRPQPALMSFAPGLLAVASLVLAFTTVAIEPLLDAYAALLPGPADYHLALWHGFEPALAISAVVVALGALLVWQRDPVARFQAAVPDTVDAGRGYLHIVSAVDRGAARLTTFIQSRGLPGYLAVIVAVFVLGLGGAAAVNGTWPDGIRLADDAAQPVIGLVMILAASAAVVVRQRLTAVLLVGATGYGMMMLFGTAGAPDLALTQALVETITIVVIVLVLRRLPKRITERRAVVRAPVRIAIGALAGIVMAVVGVVALGARTQPSVSEGLPPLAEEAHAKNLVNALLVDIRAWDTLGEISVLVAVATGVASLIFVSGRMGGAPRLDAPRRRSRLRPVPEQADSMRAPRRRLADRPDETDAAAEAASTRQTWLLAGRTLSPRNRSILVEVLVRLLFHPAIVVSVYLLFVGHNAPGGGFAGGLVAGLALVARYLAGGRYELGEAAPVDAGMLLGTGLFVAAGTAASALVFGLAVFESTWFEFDVPVLGTLSIGTSTLFDIGVYLVVVGLVLDILRTLGAEIDRQIDEAGPDAVPADPAEATR